MDSKIDPILRWVGSKKRLIDSIISNIPTNFNDYYEPFLGSGIVYLNMPFKNKAFINDYNKDLVNIYKQIKHNPSELIKTLKKYKKEYCSSKSQKEYYINKRLKFNKLKNNYNTDRAALYIFINKTCFNGLMQTNKYGYNTSGFGKMNNPKIIDESNLINFNKKLNSKTTIKNSDYIKFLNNCKKGDFVYMDPPYVPDDIKQCNIKYIKDGWNITDFENLVKTFKDLDKKGCYVMMSNSNSKFIRNNFSKKQYNIKKLKISRGLCPNSDKRNTEYELLIKNF